MALYGVAVETEDGTEFFMVSADTVGDVCKEFTTLFDGCEFEVMDAEDMLCNQYDGLAVLGTV